jgi:uncharacterized membrane protein YGL010W
MKAAKEMAALGGATLALLAGRKVTAATLFGKSLWELEKQWRARHPEFDGDLRERWRMAIEHYEATHQDPTNRLLHQIGIPLIVAGAAGLFASGPLRPVWTVSAGAFAVGWALNFVGHGLYEKKAPAFADDPLGFVAGPVWDLMQLRAKFGQQGTEAVTAGSVDWAAEARRAAVN